MSDPTTFINYYAAQIKNLTAIIEDLRIQNARLTADSTLSSNYFASASKRIDIVAQDVANAQAAITQVLFTWDSGSPTQKSQLFKMIP